MCVCCGSVGNHEPSGFEIEPRGFEDRTLLGLISNPLLRTQRVRRSNPSGFEIEPRRFDLRTLCVPRTQKGSYLRTLLGSRSNPLGSTNPEGSIFEPSAFHEPRRVRIFEPFWVRDRTLWVPRTQRVRNPGGFYLRTLLGSWNPEGSRSNLEGFDLEPSGFEERTLWVRGTQRVRRSNPLGSISNPEGFEDTNPSGFLGSISNPEGFEDMNPSGFEDTNPEGFDLRTLLGSRSNPEGFDLRTLWVRSRTQRVRRSSNPSGFEIESRGV
ncbi:hypothetical protein ACOSQ2_020562 [Xanthoceras sorbifolium]